MIPARTMREGSVLGERCELSLRCAAADDTLIPSRDGSHPLEKHVMLLYLYQAEVLEYRILRGPQVGALPLQLHRL